MEFITIYKDNDQEVLMLDIAAKQLEFVANTYLKLSSIQTEEVLDEVFFQLSKEFNFKDKIKNKKIITSSEIAILSRNKIFDLVDAYHELEEAVLLLSEVFDLTSGIVSNQWKDNVRNYIRSFYFLTFQKNCDIIFFSEKVHEVSLAIVLFKENEIFILPISLNENDIYYKLF